MLHGAGLPPPPLNFKTFNLGPIDYCMKNLGLYQCKLFYSLGKSTLLCTKGKTTLTHNNVTHKNHFSVVLCSNVPYSLQVDLRELLT